MTTLPLVTAPALTGADIRSLNTAGLHRALTSGISGEIRFDKVSRALYATDASHYQIQPLGVAIPRTPDDLTAAVQIAADLAIPITARGGGTSLSGQAIGPGLVIDCSKYLNRAGEVDVSGRRVKELYRAWRPAGPGEVRIDHQGLAPGIYLVKMRSGSQSVARRITVLQ